ncbi:hypothetical protein EDB92DRAFT_1949092 [Lactarius akahatsu]|uniref:Uncharacterized protein n=1 Tax=Lactarius akahatsu TaxID=416441 RepID=A0AAD4LAG5_9AGAM|nr:hypothetical protein EDB92DRAFT_1949092 [Lactarius akahatsu]
MFSPSQSDIRSLFKVLRENEYEKQAATNLLDNRLTIKLQNCDSADDISALTGVPYVSRPTPSPDEDVGLPLSSCKSHFRRNQYIPAAIKSVSTSYDALVDLFESIEDALIFYTEFPPTTAMTEIIVKILVELLATLGLCDPACQARAIGFVLLFVDAPLGENETDAVLQETPEVVYILVKDMKVVMDA